MGTKLMNMYLTENVDMPDFLDMNGLSSSQ